MNFVLLSILPFLVFSHKLFGFLGSSHFQLRWGVNLCGNLGSDRLPVLNSSDCLSVINCFNLNSFITTLIDAALIDFLLDSQEHRFFLLLFGIESDGLCLRFELRVVFCMALKFFKTVVFFDLSMDLKFLQWNNVYPLRIETFDSVSACFCLRVEDTFCIWVCVGIWGYVVMWVCVGIFVIGQKLSWVEKLFFFLTGKSLDEMLFRT